MLSALELRWLELASPYHGRMSNVINFILVRHDLRKATFIEDCHLRSEDFRLISQIENSVDVKFYGVNPKNGVKIYLVGKSLPEKNIESDKELGQVLGYFAPSNNFSNLELERFLVYVDATYKGQVYHRVYLEIVVMSEYNLQKVKDKIYEQTLKWSELFKGVIAFTVKQKRINH